MSFISRWTRLPARTSGSSPDQIKRRTDQEDRPRYCAASGTLYRRLDTRLEVPVLSACISHLSQVASFKFSFWSLTHPVWPQWTGDNRAFTDLLRLVTGTV